MYDDETDSWPSVYGSGVNCNCDCAIAKAKDLSPIAPNIPSGAVIDPPPIKEHLRPRFWYVAVISCSEASVDYTVTMEQIDGSQLGVNEDGLFLLYIIMFFVWGVALMGQAWASRWLWRARTFHPIIKLFTMSIFWWFLFTTCEMMHWAAFAGNGVGIPFIEGIGRVCEVLGRVTFILLVMLIAKGWTISSTVLTERPQLLGAVALLLLVYIILAIWDLAGRDPASTLYVYDSAPGVIICLLHVAVLVWFVLRVNKSFREEVHTEKRKFYWRFGLVYSFWFISLPIVVIIGAIDAPWSRQKTVESLIMVVNTFWFGALGWMLWPSRANRYFEIQQDSFVSSTHQYEDL